MNEWLYDFGLGGQRSREGGCHVTYEVTCDVMLGWTLNIGEKTIRRSFPLLMAVEKSTDLRFCSDNIYFGKGRRVAEACVHRKGTWTNLVGWARLEIDWRMKRRLLLLQYVMRSSWPLVHKLQAFKVQHDCWTTRLLLFVYGSSNWSEIHQKMP